MQENLFTLVYVSAATRLLNDDELSTLLAQCRERNASSSITGLLLYSDGNFMQLLEGPAKEVTSTFARIALDPRHHMIEKLIEVPASERVFPDWTMAYRRVDAPDWDQLISTKAGNETDSAALIMMLRMFWKSVFR